MAGIEGRRRARAQWFLRLEHHGKFGEIEAPDMNERTGALLARNRNRMREGVTDLAQAYQPKWRRQVERRREWRHALGPLRCGIGAPRICDFALEYL